MRVLLLLLAFSLPAAQAFGETKNSSEAGVVVTSGNSKAQTFNAKHATTHGWDKNEVSLKGSYMSTKSSGILSAKKWDAVLRYDRILSDKWSIFLSQGVESDKFSGYLQRYNTDIGPKYVIYREENQWDWFAEGGYRYTRERRTDGARISSQKARLYTEATRFWSATANTKLWLEYIPNFSQSKDWLWNAELSTTAALNSVLAVKAAYLVKFDNQPNPGVSKKTDTVFTTSLVATY